MIVSDVIELGVLESGEIDEVLQFFLLKRTDQDDRVILSYDHIRSGIIFFDDGII